MRLTFFTILTAVIFLGLCLVWQFAAITVRHYRKWTHRGVHARPRPGPRPLFDPQPPPLQPTLDPHTGQVRDWRPRITAGRDVLRRLRQRDDSERIAS